MGYTRRERVAKALRHEEPDRVPLDLTIVVQPYRELLGHFGMDDDLWWDEWSHAFPKPEVLERLGVDVFHLPWGRTAEGFWDPGSTDFTDEWGCRKVRVDDAYGGFLFQLTDHPLKDAKTIGDIEAYSHWPSFDEPRLEGFEQLVKQLYNETDFALTMTFGGNVFERSHYLRGMDEFFVDLLVEPEKAQAVMKKVLKINLKRNEQILKAVGKYLTYFRFQGEDFGSQASPLISVDTFRSVVRPLLEEEWRAGKTEFLRNNPDGKIAIHSCGAVFDFIPDFIEMGADILNPVQPNAAGMDTKKIKELFGDKLSFHGAVDSQGVISQGTVEEIREEVKQRLSDLMPGGGYIMSPSHNIQSNVGPEKVLAIYETAAEYGRYGK
ncbi:MAG: uroporphyrinogen decarboxylase [Clostridiales bacterium]|nr:uroporphyrinogen decarboxylase [Clostridiales bacterium]